MDTRALVEYFGFKVVAGHETAALVLVVASAMACVLIAMAAVLVLVIAVTDALGATYKAIGPFLVKLFIIGAVHLFLLAFFVRSKMLNIAYQWALQLMDAYDVSL